MDSTFKKGGELMPLKIQHAPIRIQELTKAKREASSQETEEKIEEMITHCRNCNGRECPPGNSIDCGEVITPGTNVTVQIGAEERMIRIVDPICVNLHNGEYPHISTTSPCGSALLNHKEGDEVTYEAPGGETTAKVINISKTIH